MNTELVFLKDCYAKELQAKVVESNPEEKWVELNKTIFYAESGGQPTDKGKIEWKGTTSNIREVKKRDGKILHFLEGKIPEKETEVKLILNWDLRLKYMRMHSAQHLLSALILDKHGASTVGNQIGEEKSRMDFHPIKFSQEMLKEFEDKFNEIVEKGVPIEISFKDRKTVLEEVDEKRRVLFSRLPEAIQEIRVIEIPGIDKCPCGGTHVSNTKEIGKIKITERKNKGKQRDRITFELVD
ncbi:MAG: alanyl-tRNA editing protein [Candidatus Diapherotrites archaeon CG10_big_fil_rev_8_21_14_0_10_31_34]|nr:MAG: alanyl-tRNA editing protein [Candidatus Diapherotrites archaeon CG10_big_fil_rev_8_21_14_0_10_31_34]